MEKQREGGEEWEEKFPRGVAFLLNLIESWWVFQVGIPGVRPAL